MDLLVIRHAIAEDKAEFARTGRDDAERPLTAEGRAKMRGVAAGLRSVAPELALLATSPLTRAKQTAELVAEAYGPELRVVTADVLAPDRAYDDFVDWLRRQKVSGTVAIVGHEPHLGGLVTWLLTGSTESHTPLKKGGACLLAFQGSAAAGKGSLVWMLTPGMARRLGGATAGG